jgi:ATP-dependent RNA helicase RhlE
MNFEDFGLNKQLLNAIEDFGFTKPTDIQQKVFSPITSGNDLLGIAPTGTGKTGAYVLPLIHMLKYPQDDLPRLLILAPTRELVVQIEADFKLFSKYTGLRSVVLFGGIGPKTQIEEIAKGVDVLISTPGRYMDIYKAGKIPVKKIKHIVLDEADKMMDMGFKRQIYSILETLPQKKQKLLFSATMNPKVEELALEYLYFPVKVEVAPQSTTAPNIHQVAYEIPNIKTKINFLSHFFANETEVQKVLIFCKTKTSAEQIHSFLSRHLKEKSVKVMHSNKGQNSRLNTIEGFKKEEVDILIATDVAARGLDVRELSHVINFDVPIIYEDYVHRIGRTGRAEASGKAITFFTKGDKYHFKKIEKIIKQEIELLPLPAEITIEKTPFSENQAMEREIDNQKRKDNPDFKGAFHEKKRKFK